MAALFLSLTLQRQIVGRLTDSLEAQAIVGRALLAREADLASGADLFADRLGRELRLRVTVIAADGAVLGDTDLDGEALRTVENHAGRPEVVAALAKGEGRSVRYSHTLGTDLLYVAVRIDPADATRGILRLSMPLD
ncbi:MAG TPA: PAS domain-containing sensor histidine kinase, partial [Candidatus Polarisedimenticolia bacterium]|nr:PAS domain-containing sensor histidine kinase [Candidatus Polarisedimenticolia bacterium]